MLKKITVGAFVDWNSQEHNAHQKSEGRVHRKVEATIAYVVRTISSAAQALAEADKFDVTIRLYHGWFRGLTMTEIRREVERQRRDRLLPSRIGRCSFDWGSPFGDTLLSASSSRLHRRINVHIPDTLRDDPDEPGRNREKMVDTALVSDLLTVARSEPDTLKLVLAEDDDVVPAVFAAERWCKTPGSCVVVRKRTDQGHLMLSGLLYHPKEADYDQE